MVIRVFTIEDSQASHVLKENIVIYKSTANRNTSTITQNSDLSCTACAK